MVQAKKVIGIIGGMGPLATADLFTKIVSNTKAECDQKHIRVFIDNNTNIPDRTAAILRGGDDPVPALSESAKLLQSMGADFLIMPCNTAHYFYDYVQKSVDIPVLHMIEKTRDALTKKGVRKAGLLATDGTIQSGIYQKVFDNSGIELIKPEADGQKHIMDLIYKGVKAGEMNFDTKNVCTVLDNLAEKGAEVLILGCTELPVAEKIYGLNYVTCDPTLELAKAAIEFAGYEVIK